MSPNSSIEPSTLVGGIGAALTGIAQLVMILFPLAIPLLVLTAAAAAVLALPLVALAVAAALVAGPVLAIRWIWRRFAEHFVRRPASLVHQPRRGGRVDQLG
jgi:membrane protein implicated in regulation of membrane protease activity